MYILQGDLGFIFNPHKEIRPPPPPIFGKKTGCKRPHFYNNMPLSRNNMPLSGNKDGLLTMQKSVCFSLKKVVEMFGGFEDFLYLCSVVER